MAEGKSRICLCLTASTLEKNLRLLDSRRGFADLVELRADFLDPPELPHLPSFPKRAGLPVILAIRRGRDGGSWNGEEGQRRNLLSRALSGGYAWVDLEEDLEDPAVAEAAKRAGTRVIRSLYDCSGVPEHLTGRLRSLAGTPGRSRNWWSRPRAPGTFPRW